MEATQTGLTDIKWDLFEMSDNDRLKLETGKPIRGLGFCSIKQTEVEVEDKEKTAEGTLPVKKKLSALLLGIDYKEGKPVQMELLVTSKRLAGDIRVYFEKNLLFSRLFELTREGEGYQTKYRLLALEEKPGK